MAYTYNDFLKAAGNGNMLRQFDASDLEVTKTRPEYGLSMLSLMRDRANAATPEARLLANEAIGQLRQNYGVLNTATTGAVQEETSAEDGTTALPGEFQYDKEDEYQALLEQVTNPDGFYYDPNSDPVFSAYRKMYLREGERATQDALARISASTGGIPSTYAVTAAQQAAANYAEKLSDTLPALEQQSFERYLQGLGVTQDAFEQLRYDREEEYQKYLDQYAMLQSLLSLNTESDAEPDSPGGSSGIPDGDLIYLKASYPDGVITDQSVWQWLVNTYGEDVLRAAGYSMAAQAEETEDKTAAERIAESIGALIGRIPGGN